MDIATLACLVVGTLIAVGAIKHFLPAWSKGKEEALAAVVPVGYLLVAKLCGVYPHVGWIEAVIWGALAALAAQVAYDKFVDPIVKGKSA